MKAYSGRASAGFRWSGEIRNRAAKEAVARQVAELAQPGDIIGVGSGSTAYLSLLALAKRVSVESINVSVIGSSHEIDWAADQAGLRRIPLGSARPSWIVDGLDEIEPTGRILKGRGGALFREKLLWASCQRRYVAIDSSKRVEALGTHFPVPVEVYSGAIPFLVDELLSWSSYVQDVDVRAAGGKDGPVITESGCVILDLTVSEVPPWLHASIKALPGVLETGIFEGYDVAVIDE